MVEIRDSGEEKQALGKTIGCIVERIRKELGKNLVFNQNFGFPIVSVSEKRGFFSGKHQLFSMGTDGPDILPGGKRAITCFVADRSILNIVKEELKKYADAFKIDIVEIRQ